MSLYLKKYKFLLFLITIHIKNLLSKPQKCYSINNCQKCIKLDICEICLKGYFLNKKKNKCIKSSVSLSNNISLVSRFKSSEKFFSKMNISSTLKSLENNFNYSSISINIDEVIPNPKHYNIIKLPYISSAHFKKEDENILIHIDKYSQSINKINVNAENRDNDFYFRITIAWIFLLIVLLVILLILYFSKLIRNRIKYSHDDLEEISRIVDIR